MKNECAQTRSDRRNGQSIVEYIILMAIVIALLLVFFNPGVGGYFRRAFTNVIEIQGRDMLNAARTIF